MTIGRHKSVLRWGGVTATVLMLGPGVVACAHRDAGDPKIEAGEPKTEGCITMLEGVKDVQGMSISDSGEYIAANGFDNFVLLRDGKPTTIDDNTSATAVNSEGVVVSQDNLLEKALVHTGQEVLELQPPEGVGGSVSATDISDSGTIVGSVSPEGDSPDVPVKWEDPAAQAEPLPTPEGASGSAAVITADDTIVGTVDDSGLYWTEDDHGEFENFPDEKFNPKVSHANGDWTVTSSDIDSEGPEYYHLMPITGSSEPVKVALTGDEEATSSIHVDTKGRVYGSGDEGTVMVADGDVTKLPEPKGSAGVSVSDVSSDGSVLAGTFSKELDGPYVSRELPLMWRDCE